MNKDTTLAWLQELSARGLIQPTGAERFSTYPRPGQEPITLTPAMSRKYVAQVIARSAKGNAARMTRAKYLNRAAHKAKALGRVPGNPAFLTQAYVSDPGHVIPTEVGHRWAYLEAIGMPHVEEAALGSLAVELGWSVKLASPITDSPHESEQNPVTLVKGMIARVESSTDSRVAQDREAAIEELEYLIEHVKRKYSMWGYAL